MHRLHPEDTDGATETERNDAFR